MSIDIDIIEEVYYNFRKAKADYFNRKFKMPKDFEKYFNDRLREKNKEAFIKISGWFLTKWCDVDKYYYFKCGFELHKKKFTYVNFFDNNIMKLYKIRDKTKKRETEVRKDKLIESASFVKKWMLENDVKCINDYINIIDGERRIAIEHYMKNYIDASFFVYLMNKGMLLSDSERGMIPYVVKNFRTIKFGLNDIKIFLNKMENKL